MIHLFSNKITKELRQKANEEFKMAGQSIETHMPITMMTLSVHQVLVEAERQIPKTGPIKESMSSWIERLCKLIVEPTARRFFFYLFFFFFFFCLFLSVVITDQY